MVASRSWSFFGFQVRTQDASKFPGEFPLFPPWTRYAYSGVWIFHRIQKAYQRLVIPKKQAQQLRLREKMDPSCWLFESLMREKWIIFHYQMMELSRTLWDILGEQFQTFQAWPPFKCGEGTPSSPSTQPHASWMQGWSSDLIKSSLSQIILQISSPHRWMNNHLSPNQSIVTLTKVNDISQLATKRLIVED